MRKRGEGSDWSWLATDLSWMAGYLRSRGLEEAGMFIALASMSIRDSIANKGRQPNGGARAIHGDIRAPVKAKRRAAPVEVKPRATPVKSRLRAPIQAKQARNKANRRNTAT